MSQLDFGWFPSFEWARREVQCRIWRALLIHDFSWSCSRAFHCSSLGSVATFGFDQVRFTDQMLQIWLFQPNDLGTRSSGPPDPFIFRWFSTSQPAETNTSRRSRPHFPLGFIRLSTPCILPWRRAWHVDARVRDTWCWQSWGVHRVRLRVFEHVSMPRPSPSSLGTAHCRWPVSWQYLNTWDGSNTVDGIFAISICCPNFVQQPFYLDSQYIMIS